MKKVLIVFLSLFILPNFMHCQSFEKSIIKSDTLISKLAKESNIPGLAVAIFYKDKLIWSEEYGYSNLEYNIQTSDKSKFRIASISKLFTGTAIFKLYKEGKLQLDDPISKYVDSLPNSLQKITIRQIAQHSSGIGHYIDVNDALDVHHYTSTKEALKKFINRPLKHQPDKGITYSSYAYTLLASVIEKVVGKDFPDAMNEIIFEPLKMKSTEVDNQKKIINNRTGFYQYSENRKPEHAPYIDLSAKWAGSGFLSSAIDLARFGNAHTYSSEIFTKAELNILTSPRKINDTLKTKEGFGWGKRIDWEGRMMFFGDGKTPGSTCGLVVYPEHELSIAIVSNMRNAPIDRGEFQILATRFLSVIEGKKIKELTSKDFGTYELNIKIGQNVLKGNMKLNDNSNSKNISNFNFIGVQKFNIVDAFWVEEDLWVFAIGGGKQPISLGFLPIKININQKEIKGEIFRIDAKINGVKN